MTKNEWLTSLDPEAMLFFVKRHLSERKARLFACASFRQLLARFEGFEREIGEVGGSIRAVSAAEHFAESGVVTAELAECRCRGYWITKEDPYTVAHIAIQTWTATSGSLNDSLSLISDVLRHIAGDPFNVKPPLSWPSAVLDLARAFDDGDDIRLIFADALEEAGQDGMANHFRDDPWHPKGCWAMDFILSRDR